MSDTVCPLLWNAVHIRPDGKVFPCCISDHDMEYGDIFENTIDEIFQGWQWKSARRAMKHGEKVEACNYCYNLEDNGINSPRQDYKKRMDQHMNLVHMTDDMGNFENTNLQFVDIRFSNICNMKCRMCGPDFSSQWQEEYRRLNGNPRPLIINWKEKTNIIIDELLEHSHTITDVYFAGGEPLITDEHYTFLEKLIQKDVAKNIMLRYSSNGSQMTYKKKDIASLWKHFNNVQFFLSADDYKERAEYLRHGVSWSVIEENIKTLNSIDNVLLMMNSVITVFNYGKYHEFYNYMIDNNYIKPQDIQVTNVQTPLHMSSQILPMHLKKRFQPAVESINNNYVVDTMWKYCNADNRWEQEKDNFLKELHYRDKVRNEDFEKVFPELKELIHG